jgi:hypothetical protein
VSGVCVSQQVDAGAAEHLAFEHNEPVDVAIDGAGSVGQGQAVADRMGPVMIQAMTSRTDVAWRRGAGHGRGVAEPAQAAVDGQFAGEQPSCWISGTTGWRCVRPHASAGAGVRCRHRPGGALLGLNDQILQDGRSNGLARRSPVQPQLAPDRRRRSTAMQACLGAPWSAPRQRQAWNKRVAAHQSGQGRCAG